MNVHRSDKNSTGGRTCGFNQDPQALTDQDLTAAMKEISGYLDITPGDLKELYSLAYTQARKRILSKQARDIVVTSVHSVPVDMPVKEVAELLARVQVAGVPVVDGENKVVGVISEKDFIRRMSGSSQSFMGLVAACMQKRGCPALSIQGRTAGDIMSAPAVTVAPDTPLHQIFALMQDKDINRLPVTDADQLMLGIISRDDVLRALSALPCS